MHPSDRRSPHAPPAVLYSAMTQPRLRLFFDLDGTLTDPFDGITRSIQHAMVSLDRAPIDALALRACIGPPLRESFRALLGSDDPELVERAVAAYRERYFDVGLFENTRYDGVPEMLASLRERGHALRVVTSKVTPAAERIVEHFGLAEYFEAIHGSETGGRFDDKGELIAHVLDDCAATCDECVMIGDRMHDISAGRRNGVRTIGVTWGFGSLDELRDAGADVICDDPSHVEPAISRLALSSPAAASSL
jgi:phosphoglycolate phosphatase